jgi:tetratricopeptide (TPR) repeat protein
MSDQSPDQDFADVVAAVGAGDRPRALELADRALSQGVDHPLILLLVAERLDEQGRIGEALQLLRRASEAAPEAAEVWRRYGVMLGRQGHLAEGLAALQEALEIEPESYAAQVDAGAISFRLADLPAAETHYRRAAVLAPQAADPPAALAVIAARRDDFVVARQMGELALSRDPASVSAHVAIGRADLHQGAPAQAEARMGALLPRSDLADDLRVAVLDLQADALDAMDEPGPAFAAYAARNVLLGRIHAPRMDAEIRERRLDRARRVARRLASLPPESWRAPNEAGPASHGGARGHVFLLGFPRSGTTLLEKALAGHPDVVTLEEVDHLELAAGRLLASDAALDHLLRLPAAEARACCKAYWSAAADSLGGNLAGRIVVDKLPLHTANLPLIARLFPEAAILFALRDPRDVVFSCFRRLFRINAAMYEFLTLEGAAHFYDQVMTIAEICRARAPLHLMEVRHEEVVADFDARVGEVLAFIGADWDPGVRGYAERARAALRTPSDPQVARGLNARGVGQWRRYQTELEPIRTILAPWVSRFGYGS